MKNMNLQFSKAGTSDALILNCISKSAFDSDIDVGAPTKCGPPGYMSLPFHMKMARMNHLYKLTDNGLIVGGAIGTAADPAEAARAIHEAMLACC